MDKHNRSGAPPQKVLLQEEQLHSYQQYCVDFIEEHPQCGIFLEMGLGKTAITLTALAHLLYDSFDVSRVLIIAPLRVARDTWIAELGKWEHLAGLRMEDNTQDADTPECAEEEADEALEADDGFDDSEIESSGITQMCVSIPLDNLTAPVLINILKLVYTRQSLIAAMTQSDLIHIDEELMDLLHDEKPDSVERICELLEGEIHAGKVRGIDLADGKLTMAFPFDEADPTRWKHYSALMLAIVERAKSAHHISGKRLNLKADEEKYYCRNWLIQLGLGIAEHKETQRVLLDHLHGYAAFRSTDKMAAHKAKYAALRKELREEKEATEIEAVE